MTGRPPALLLAAGLGTRLAPLTDHLPKCLMPIGGRPLLGLWLDLLAEAGFEDIIVNTHHHADTVADYVARSPHARRVRLAHEPVLLGTAGTIARFAPATLDGPLLIAHADNLSLFDVRAFLQQAHADRPREVVLTMMTFDPDDPRRCGVVELGAERRVIGFHEKVADPPTRLANAAIYLADPEVVSLCREQAARSGGYADFSTQILPGLVGRIQAVHNDLYHRDIGSPSSLARAQIDYPAAETEARRRGLFTPTAEIADRSAEFASSLERLGIRGAGPGLDDLP